MAACNRRGRKAEAHRRWESVSSTIDIPCGVVLNDVPDAAVKSVAPSFQDKPSSSTSSEAPAARATPPSARQQDGHPSGGGDGSSGVNSVGVGVAGPAHEQTSGGGTIWEDDGDDDDKEVYIPTEDLGVFMATLMDGMRSDGVQLAQSAKSVVANTYQVVVRPWEAVTRMAAPFLPTNPPHIQPSRENTRRGHELLDNALAFRMPGAFGSARPRQPGVADDRVGAGNGGGGALRTIDGNSPPRSTPPSSPSRGRSSRAAFAGGGGDARASGVRKRGRGAQRGRLGAVKLDATPPKDGGSGSSKSGCELPSAAVEPVAATAAPLRSCSPPASPSQECGVGGGLLRRLSLSKSPPRRILSFKNVLPFGGGSGGGGGAGETGSSTHRCRAVAKPAAATGVGGKRAGTGGGPRRSPAVVTEGSRIDLRGLDRAKGGNNPRAYRCKDGSIVVLGRERMLSVLPDGSSGAESDSGIDGGKGGGGGAGSSGLVTWVLRYTELESCSINVSAGKESEHAVGDVVVEVTTRPKTEASATGSKAASTSTTNKPGRRSFCLTNPSDCLELLRSIQLRWQPSSSPPSSSPASSSSSAGGATGKEKPLAMDPAVLGDGTPSRVGDSGGTGDAWRGKAGGEGGGGNDDDGAGDDNSSSLGAVKPLRELREGSAAGGSGGGAGTGIVSPSSSPPPEASVVLSPPGSKSEAGSVASSPFSGVKRGVIILESPAKVLRDQLKERHEQHERGLKEDLEQRRKSSKASLMRRRELRRRSVSQSPCRSGCGGLNRGFDASPLPMITPSTLPDGATAPEVEAAGPKQPDLSKYKNMKKAGLPNGAIRQRMTMDDLASYVALVLDPSSSSPAISAEAMPPPPARAGSAAVPGSAAARASPTVPKTPPAAAAAAAGNAITPSPGGIPPPPPLPLACKIPPPPPPPMSGMLIVPPPLPVALGRGCSDKSLLGPGLRLGSGPPCSPLDPISSCRSEGGGFFGGRVGGSVPSPAPTPAPRRTSKPLLNFHWDVLPPAKIERTVWAKRRTAAAAAAMAGGVGETCGSPRTTLSVDDAEVEELEKLFSKKTAKAAAAAAAAALGQGGRRVTLGAGTGGPGLGGAAVEGKDLSGSSGGGRRGGVGRGGGGGAGGRVKKVSLLDVNRGNNVAIGLKAFRRVGDVSELAKLVSGLDPQEVLTIEDLQRLEGCLPTAQELRTVVAFSGPAAALGSAETFFRALKDTPRPASKVSAVLFSRQFLGSVAGDAESRVETLRMACEEAMESDRLAAVLEKVLDIGNLLNEGTYQGNACGFRISSLLKLSHTKSHSDKKTTVLHYMVRTFATKERSAAAATAAATAAASPSPPGKTLKSKTPPRSTAEKQRSAAWPGGAPPGCRGSGMSGGGTRASKVRREVSGTSSGAASPGAGASQRGAVTPGRGGSAVRANSGYLLRAGGKRRGSSAAAVELTRVEALDLESELKHVRQASKTPVGEIMMDVRQARKGLRQAKEELDRTLVEEEKKKEETKGAGASANGGGAAKAAASRPSEVSERSCSSSLSPAASGSSSSSLSSGGEIEGGTSLGVRKLAAFVDEAGARLSSIEQRASACVGLCKGLGEFFGEGDDEAQSAHILRTLVDFMDLLEEAKKVEGLC